MIKINQSAFIKDLVIKERLTKCKVNVIPIKTGSFIKMSELNDYNNINFQTCQQLIEKLMYLMYGIILDIAFIVNQLSKHNTNSRK